MRKKKPANRPNIFCAILSFFIVGLGQILKGKAEKGLKFILLFYFALPAVVYFSLIMSGALFIMTFGIGTIFGIIFWVYNIIDAYKS